MSRQFGHALGDFILPALRDFDRQKIRIREITVIHRIFLGSHLTRFIAVRVIKTRGLHDFSARFDQFNLTVDFVVNGVLQELKRVDVFNFAARAELCFAHGAHRHVGVTPEVSFLHIAVRNTEPHDQRVQCLGVAHGFSRTSQLRLRHDFKQRRTGAV